MHRLFVAIRPPESVLDLLIDTMEGLPSLRWQDEDQLHLTLRFIGEVDRPLGEDLAAALTALHVEGFTIRISGVGRFDHQRRGALWAGVEPRDKLAALAAKVERACVGVGLPPERRAFHPHITLARLKPTSGTVRNLLELAGGLSSPPFRIDDFALFESKLTPDGAVYTVVESYPLD